MSATADVKPIGVRTPLDCCQTPAGADLENAAKLNEMIGASWMSQAVYAAAELRIADLLAQGDQHADTLAAASGCQPTSLLRLLRALASLGLCLENDDGSYALTAMGALLRTDARNSLRSWAIWWGRRQWSWWGNLAYSVKTGDSARRLATGHQGYQHLEMDPEVAALFNQAMVEMSRLVAGEVAGVVVALAPERVVDVGGGYGEVLVAVLAAHPTLQAILFDLPHTLDGARGRIAAAGMAQRCELLSGSFFDFIPGGGDIYILKSVLHNWDDARCALLLANCHRAMAHCSRLLIVERLLPARMTGSLADQAVARADLNMLVGVGGRERQLAEYHSLLTAAGFAVAAEHALALGFSVIVATRR